jgi:hypothetical protein
MRKEPHYSPTGRPRPGILLLFCCVCSLSLLAQPEDDNWFYGFRGGVTYGSVDGIANTIIPPVFPAETYTTTESRLLGYTGGIFLYYRFAESRLAIQPSISFGQGGGQFDYSDINALEYQINFNYQYASIGAELKFYPFGGFHVGTGAEVGFNVAGDRLTYTSNQPELGPDLQIQQSLREVLRGGNDARLLFGVGYDFPFGLVIDLRYRMGLTDAIETLANGFNFVEYPNKTTTLRATVGWIIPFFK